MPTRQEVLSYYKGFEDALRIHALRVPGQGNIKYLGHVPLTLALDRMKEAKKLALEQAEKPEPPKFAIIAGEPNNRGVIVAEVRSFTDPGKTYRVAYDVETKRVHCTCESFKRLTWQVGNPKASDTLSHCKHIALWLPELIKSAEGQ